MKKFLILLAAGCFFSSCEQKMDACECGKKMVNKDSKEALDCNDYWRPLDLDEQEKFMEKAMKCYANESLGTDIK